MQLLVSFLLIISSFVTYMFSKKLLTEANEKYGKLSGQKGPLTIWLLLILFCLVSGIVGAFGLMPYIFRLLNIEVY